MKNNRVPRCGRGEGARDVEVLTVEADGIEAVEEALCALLVKPNIRLLEDTSTSVSSMRCKA